MHKEDDIVALSPGGGDERVRAEVHHQTPLVQYAMFSLVHTYTPSLQSIHAVVSHTAMVWFSAEVHHSAVGQQIRLVDRYTPGTPAGAHHETLLGFAYIPSHTCTNVYTHALTYIQALTDMCRPMHTC